MSTLLHLTSSLFGAEGQSSRLSRSYVQRLRQHSSAATLLTRDLSTDPVPHLTAAAFAAGLKPVHERTPEEQRQAALGDVLIAEVEAADLIVIGMPMYNFGVPSTLKAWFDHIARPGRTFRYTSNGPEGLLRGKQAEVFATRGGLHAGTARDTQTAFVQQFLGFLGITDIQFIHAEGLGMGAVQREQALRQAESHIDDLLAGKKPTAVALAA